MNKYLQDELCAPLPELNKADDLLFASVIDKVSPASAVNSLYGLIHRPIIAFDTSFRLIAYAFPRPFFYAPWEEIASTESLSDSYIYENNALFYQEKMYYLKYSSYFNTDITANCPQVDGPIISDGKLIGYVGICVASDDEVETIAYINDRLAETLALLIPRYKKNLHNPDSDDIWDRLISRDMIDISDALELESDYPPAYHVAVLTPQNGQIPTLQYIKGCLDNTEDSISTYIDQNEHIVILYYNRGLSPSEDSSASILINLENYCEKYKLYGGISDKFYHLKDISAARLQAEVSIEVGNRNYGTKRIYSFRDLYEDIICAYAFERYGITTAMPPAMRSYSDSEKIDSLIPTLEAYIFCDCNQEKAAYMLGIHKNTVHYRIKQFTELTGADPSNASQLLQIKIGLMMHSYSTTLEKRIRKGGSK